MGAPHGFFTVKPSHNLPHGGHFNTRLAWFAGDTIKATRRLTLNLGVRYEYDSGYFNNDRNVVRDPVMERWGRGFSALPNAPNNLFSPSVGFGFDPVGSGKTVIRGGFYRAYEMNIFNNLMFDEFCHAPARHRAGLVRQYRRVRPRWHTDQRGWQAPGWRLQ